VKNATSGVLLMLLPLLLLPLLLLPLLRQICCTVCGIVRHGRRYP